MANVKAEGTTRKQKLFMIDPVNMEYLREKGKLFERGGRGGESEALNRMIEFVRDYEKRMGGQ